MRDYLDGSWNFSKCGNCDHNQVSHTNWSSGAKNLVWVKRCKVTHDGFTILPHQCQCKQWVPKDNLDRIEYLAEQRGLL
jgi:hypothetical protein